MAILILSGGARSVRLEAGLNEGSPLQWHHRFTGIGFQK
jgi:hypothetical protein